AHPHQRNRRRRAVMRAGGIPMKTAMTSQLVSSNGARTALLYLLAFAGLFWLVPAFAQDEAEIVFDSGNVAWMLTSTLLVLLMVVPGLALFYGGMVRSKNV